MNPTIDSGICMVSQATPSHTNKPSFCAGNYPTCPVPDISNYTDHVSSTCRKAAYVSGYPQSINPCLDFEAGHEAERGYDNSHWVCPFQGIIQDPSANHPPHHKGIMLNDDPDATDDESWLLSLRQHVERLGDQSHKTTSPISGNRGLTSRVPNSATGAPRKVSKRTQRPSGPNIATFSFNPSRAAVVPVPDRSNPAAAELYIPTDPTVQQQDFWQQSAACTDSGFARR
ncbi:hypothetical protein K470DRAFT_294607 [Piedraia hortae CBS 480.64]|uniref:Uncharacterized protein n=1 Tax=Piedraia hortae CBS 480.64 TaxID=1314780 RepID=A0A6A7C046_9PEZI|nr:hypothetical protein K470DRAFT_294607 [Piedraia hortae CBS 480.64]